jgi:hypothetical protein
VCFLVLTAFLTCSFIGAGNAPGNQIRKNFNNLTITMPLGSKTNQQIAGWNV